MDKNKISKIFYDIEKLSFDIKNDPLSEFTNLYENKLKNEIKKITNDFFRKKIIIKNKKINIEKLIIFKFPLILKNEKEKEKLDFYYYNIIISCFIILIIINKKFIYQQVRYN